MGFLHPSLTEDLLAFLNSDGPFSAATAGRHPTSFRVDLAASEIAAQAGAAARAAYSAYSRSRENLKLAQDALLTASAAATEAQVAASAAQEAAVAQVAAKTGIQSYPMMMPAQWD